MAELTPDQWPAPWVPERDLQNLKVLGKTAEETGELGAILARCIIQGIGEAEPITGKPNRRALEDEVADVEANLEILKGHFGLDRAYIEQRRLRKYTFIGRWLEALEPEGGIGTFRGDCRCCGTLTLVNADMRCLGCFDDGLGVGVGA